MFFCLGLTLKWCATCIQLIGIWIRFHKENIILYLETQWGRFFLVQTKILPLQIRSSVSASLRPRARATPLAVGSKMNGTDSTHRRRDSISTPSAEMPRRLRRGGGGAGAAASKSGRRPPATRLGDGERRGGSSPAVVNSNPTIDPLSLSSSS